MQPWLSELIETASTSDIEISVNRNYGEKLAELVNLISFRIKNNGACYTDKNKYIKLYFTTQQI